ncbi:MAG: thioredoxin family protein [Fibromonadaceae bacterium]|nr:thioredoxin family protein [Fibromonadaceae bacterium]
MIISLILIYTCIASDSYEQSLAKSKKDGKLLFVNFTAKWCGSCKIMERTTLKDSTILAELEKYHFVNIDIDTTKYFFCKNKKQTLKKCLEDWEIYGYPTYAIIDAKGHLKHLILGSMPPNKFLIELKKNGQIHSK